MQGLRLRLRLPVPTPNPNPLLRRILPLLVGGLLAGSTVWAQRVAPSPESAACSDARVGLDAALQAHVMGNAASSARLEGARRQTQSACLGGDAAKLPGERAMPLAPFAVPGPQRPAMRMPPPAMALPAPSPSVPVVPPPSPRVLGPCDATGCWDNQGRRLNEGGGIYSAPGGGVCSVQGVFATCP